MRSVSSCPRLNLNWPQKGDVQNPLKGTPSSALLPLFWEGSPTRIDYRNKVMALILTSLLEDLGTDPEGAYALRAGDRQSAFLLCGDPLVHASLSVFALALSMQYV